MKKISRKVLIVPIAIAAIGIPLVILMGPMYYFMFLIIPTWLTLFLLLNRNFRKNATSMQVSYICQVCGTDFKSRECPKCGSTSKRVKF